MNCSAYSSTEQPFLLESDVYPTACLDACAYMGARGQHVLRGRSGGRQSASCRFLHTFLPTYDPLSKERSGRAEYGAEFARAIVNTARQFEAAKRLRRAGTAAAGAAAKAARAARSGAHRPRGLSPPRRAGVPAVLVDSVPLFATPAGAPQRRDCSLSSPTTFAPACRPKTGAGRSDANAHCKGMTPSRRSVVDVGCFPLREVRGGSHRADLCVPTLDHKQLTEAFYGNYSGGLFARQTYLYFLSNVNHYLVGSCEGSHYMLRAARHKADKSKRSMQATLHAS